MFTVYALGGQLNGLSLTVFVCMNLFLFVWIIEGMYVYKFGFN